MTQKRSQSSSKLEENQWKNIANQFKGENIERYFIDFPHMDMQNPFLIS